MTLTYFSNLQKRTYFMISYILYVAKGSGILTYY